MSLRVHLAAEPGRTACGRRFAKAQRVEHDRGVFARRPNACRVCTEKSGVAPDARSDLGLRLRSACGLLRSLGEDLSKELGEHHESARRTRHALNDLEDAAGALNGPVPQESP